MKPRRMSDVARAVEGLFLGQDVEVTSAAIDSRDVAPGGLFVALPGERTDGGRFVPEAFANGAAGALVRDGLDVDGPAVYVRSTGEALMMLARDERSRMDANVVAVTGANGKTSTKDMAGAVLATRFRTHASRESLNNEVGLPMTLLGAPPDTQVVVAEMGARHVGDVAILCAIARPDIAVVTNVGVAHLEVFGSWERIVEASRGTDRGVGCRRRGHPQRGRCRRRRVCRQDLRTGRDVRALPGRRRARRGRHPWSGRTGVVHPGLGVRSRTGHARRARRAHGVERARRGGDRRDARRGACRVCRGAVAGRRVAVADGDVHHAGGRTGRQRRVQREPRIDGGRVAGRAMDGGGGAPHRGARHHGRAGSDRGQGARADRRAGGTDPRGSTDRGRRVRAIRSPTPGSARASSRTTSRATRTPIRCWTTCGGRRAPATWCCSRGRASPASSGWQRRCGEVHPGRRRVRARRHVAGHAHRDQGVPRVGLGAADPRGRPAHPHGEDGHPDDGRHRHRDRPVRRVPRVPVHVPAPDARGSRACCSRRSGSRSSGSSTIS